MTSIVSAPHIVARRAPVFPIVSILAVWLVAIVPGCTTDTSRSTAPETPPSVLASEPPDLATGVDPSTPILIQFNIAIDPATLTESSIRLLHLGQPVPVERSYEPLSARAELAPSSPLAAGMPYSIEVTREVADATGQVLLAAYRAVFVTAGDGTPGVPDDLWIYVPPTDPGARDTLRIYASERGIIARGSLVCHELGLPVIATVTGVLDEQLEFVAGSITSGFSMQVQGAFAEHGARWCLTGSVRIHAETPSPHQVCDETRPLGSICR